MLQLGCGESGREATLFGRDFGGLVYNDQVGLDCHVFGAVFPDIFFRRNLPLFKWVNHLVWSVYSVIYVTVRIVLELWVELVMEKLLLSKLGPQLLEILWLWTDMDMPWIVNDGILLLFGHFSWLIGGFCTLDSLLSFLKRLVPLNAERIIILIKGSFFSEFSNLYLFFSRLFIKFVLDFLIFMLNWRWPRTTWASLV